jgi:hypothetical protein
MMCGVLHIDHNTCILYIYKSAHAHTHNTGQTKMLAFSKLVNESKWQCSCSRGSKGVTENNKQFMCSNCMLETLKLLFSRMLGRCSGNSSMWETVLGMFNVKFYIVWHVALFFWGQLSPSKGRNFTPFWKCKGSLSCSQESTIGSNPEPGTSRLYAHILFSGDLFSCYQHSHALVQFCSILGCRWLVSFLFLRYYFLFSGVSQNGTYFSMSPVLSTMKEFSKSFNGHMLFTC